MMRVYYFIRYVFIFIRELVIANYQVTCQVLSPTLRIRPGFVAIDMEAQSDLEVTCLANSITLTPGTIAVHVADGRRTIIVHALQVPDDPEELRQNIKQSLEASILKWTRRPEDIPGDRS